MYGDLEPRKAFVMLEPPGCREGFSDTVELLRFDAAYRWRGQTWDRMVVALRKDASCNLELLAPTLKADPMGEPFFGTLSRIRPCTNALCEGEAIGQQLRPLVEHR